MPASPLEEMRIVAARLQLKNRAQVDSQSPSNQLDSEIKKFHHFCSGKSLLSQLTDSLLLPRVTRHRLACRSSLGDVARQSKSSNNVATSIAHRHFAG